MLSGSHTVRLWYSDPAHFRLALPVPLGETDVIRNGGTGWVWESSSNSVQRIMLPARPGGVHASPATGAGSMPTPLTPQQAAQRLLTAVGPTTSVTSGPTTTVAGQDAYQLVVAPKDSRSLVGRMVVEIDAQHPGVVLGVQLFARGAASPAFQIGFTSITFAAPPACSGAVVFRRKTARRRARHWSPRATDGGSPSWRPSRRSRSGSPAGAARRSRR